MENFLNLQTAIYIHWLILISTIYQMLDIKKCPDFLISHEVNQHCNVKEKYLPFKCFKHIIWWFMFLLLHYIIKFVYCHS